MAFKNFDVAKQYAIDGKLKESAPKKKSAAQKKVATAEANDVNILEFKAMTEKNRKTTSLNIRITEETKQNIDSLARRYGISQSDLISALVANAMKQE